MKFERNTPCPCGSGIKFKRCCGRDTQARQALEDWIEACAEAVALPALTPLLRPACEGFDGWARTARLVGEPPPELLDAGVEAMGAAERERLVRECERVCGQAWTSLCAEIRDEEKAVSLLLRGAVSAGLSERQPVPGPLADELLRHREICGEPPCTLSIALDGTDLWSIVEAAEAAEAATDLLDRTRARWSESHDRRLDRVLELLREALPPGSPAVAVVDEARRALEPELRLELAAMLLGDAIEVADALRLAA